MSIVRFSVAALAVLAAAGCATVPRASDNAQATAVQAPPRVKLATNPGTLAEAGAVADNRIAVDFPTGGADLTDADNKKLDLAARLFRDARPVAMFVAGYSDPTGDEYRNVLLSARRAEVVKKALVARGIPQDVLLIQAFGETDLADPRQPDNEANRRAVITWRLL